MPWESDSGSDGDSRPVLVQFGKEASRTRDYCLAKNATLRDARPDSSRRKKRLFGMTIKLHLYLAAECVDTKSAKMLALRVLEALLLLLFFPHNRNG
jgi:hypothetical protein